MAQLLPEKANRLENVSFLTETNPTKIIDIGSRLIRFEVRKDLFNWVGHDQIMFVKSADHYVRALIQDGSAKKWMIRHSTLKDLFVLLSKNDFIRLNKFYIISRKHFSHIDFPGRLLFLTDGTPIPISHRISPFIIESIKIRFT